MPDNTLNLNHTLFTPTRDSYGFALRPQHTQRYKEYAVFYEEEEEERAEKWKKFLEQILKPEEKSEESLPPHVTKAEPSVQFEEEEYQESLQAEASTLKADSPSGHEEKFETTKEIADSVSGEEDVKEQSQPEHPQVEAEANSGQDEGKVIVQDETAEEITESVTEEEEFKGSLSSEDTEGKPGTVSGQIILQPENREEEAQSNSIQGGEADESGDRECVSSGSTEGDIKNNRLAKGTKTKKVQTWAPLRKSLGAIEDLMCSRVKDTKMKFEQKSRTRDILPSIKEYVSMEKASEENCEEEVCKRLTSDDSANESIVDSAANYSDSPEHSFPWKEELESLVHGGVPKDLRGEVWQAFVGVKARRVEKYYQNLLDQVHAEEGKERDNQSGVPRKWKRQIEKDIPRTFPGHPALDENGRNSLRRVLLAYAQHNPSVGYCQAMNFFAGLLLLLMPEENAFWALAGIIDEYFDGYYSEEMIESQVDQLVFEQLMRERFPKLVNHLDYLGVQVTWISAPWFLSIFVNMLPWESVLRIWDVLLFEGNRVMLFRTALALMELYGPALVATKDAGDAITLLQSLAGSTFDSSHLVLTASMGYLAINESRLQDLREKHRPAVVELVEQRMKKGRVWKDTKGLASKLYSFKHDRASLIEEAKSKRGPGDVKADGIVSLSNSPSNLDELLTGVAVDSEADSLPDLQEQVVWLKVELCRSLQEKRSAELRAEELETALMEMVKQDNRRQLSARIEHLEQELVELRQALADKKEQETAMLQVLMRIEQEQRIAEDARRSAEQEAAAQRCAVQVLQEKYDKAMASLGEMEKRKVMAESLLEATLQYETGQARAQSSPRSVRPQENSSRMLSLFGWRDKTKSRQDNVGDCSDRKPDDIKESDTW